MDKEILMLQMTEIAAQLGWDITALKLEDGTIVGVMAGREDVLEALIAGEFA
jgi:hypothetical protein